MRKPKHTQRVAPDLFCLVCRAELGVEVVREFRFHTIRRWRFDYAVPEHRIALEVEGGVWTGGRHTSPKGFLSDMEKYNAAALMGWVVVRTTPDKLLTDGVQIVKELIDKRSINYERNI